MEDERRQVTERAPLHRDAIIAEAREMIRSGGLAALSLRRLAKHLGVTAPALYTHVGDKSDLVRAIADVEFSALRARFANVSADTAIDRVRAHCQAYVDHARENPELFEVMFVFPPDVEPFGAPDRVALPAATEVFSIGLGAIEDAIAAGDIVSDDPLLVSLTLWAAAHGVATSLQLGFGFDAAFAERVSSAVTDRMLAGWAARPARPPGAKRGRQPG